MSTTDKLAQALRAEADHWVKLADQAYRHEMQMPHASTALAQIKSTKPLTPTRRRRPRQRGSAKLGA